MCGCRAHECEHPESIQESWPLHDLPAGFAQPNYLKGYRKPEPPESKGKWNPGDFTREEWIRWLRELAYVLPHEVLTSTAAKNPVATYIVQLQSRTVDDLLREAGDQADDWPLGKRYNEVIDRNRKLEERNRVLEECVNRQAETNRQLYMRLERANLPEKNLVEGAPVEYSSEDIQDVCKAILEAETQEVNRVHCVTMSSRLRYRIVKGLQMHRCDSQLALEGQRRTLQQMQKHLKQVECRASGNKYNWVISVPLDELRLWALRLEAQLAPVPSSGEDERLMDSDAETFWVWEAGFRAGAGDAADDRIEAEWTAWDRKGRFVVESRTNVSVEPDPAAPQVAHCVKCGIPVMTKWEPGLRDVGLPIERGASGEIHGWRSGPFEFKPGMELICKACAYREEGDHA